MIELLILPFCSWAFSFIDTFSEYSYPLIPQWPVGCFFELSEYILRTQAKSRGGEAEWMWVNEGSLPKSKYSSLHKLQYLMYMYIRVFGTSHIRHQKKKRKKEKKWKTQRKTLYSVRSTTVTLLDRKKKRKTKAWPPELLSRSGLEQVETGIMYVTVLQRAEAQQDVIYWELTQP